MRRLSAVSAVVLVVLGAAACGRDERVPRDGEALCSAGYEPRELADLGPFYSASPARSTGETRTTDAATIRKIAAAACALPAPPDDVACTLELGPSYQLRFVDAGGGTTSLTAQDYGCQFVEGLTSRRYRAKPLWEALIAAGLPAPAPR